jgi:hypothetical protein
MTIHCRLSEGQVPRAKIYEKIYEFVGWLSYSGRPILSFNPILVKELRIEAAIPNLGWKG